MTELNVEMGGAARQASCRLTPSDERDGKREYYRGWFFVTPMDELNLLTRWVVRTNAPQQRSAAARPMASFQCKGRGLMGPRTFVAGVVMAALLTENGTELKRSGDFVL